MCAAMTGAQKLMESPREAEETGPGVGDDEAEQTDPELDEIGALLQSVAEGNQADFRKLYDLTAGRVLMTTLRILRDQALAEDAAQQAFIKVWRYAGSYRPDKGGGAAWIGQIARNAALDLIDRRGPMVPIEDIDLGSYDIEPSDPRLLKCLAKLPEPRGKAIIYMYVYGLTHSELAEQLSAPIGTVKSWIRRGIIELKECLSK